MSYPKRKNRSAIGILVWLLISSQVFSQAALADIKAVKEVSASTLATPRISQPNPYTSTASAHKESVLEAWRIYGVLCAIGHLRFAQRKKVEQIPHILRRDFLPAFLEGTDVENIRDVEKGLVSVKFVRAGVEYEVGIADISAPAKAKKISQPDWVRMGSFAFRKETERPVSEAGLGDRHSTQAGTAEQDIKGEFAGKGEDVAAKLIAKGSVIEIMLEGGRATKESIEGGAITAYRVQYLKGYKPGVTDTAEYRGIPEDLRKIFKGCWRI
jgi:hypothetical protein